mgnify:CR=1 FL=1
MALLDETGEPRFTVKAEGGWPNGGLIPLGDGRMGTVRAVMGAPGEYAWTLHVIDKETKGLGAAFQLAAGTSNGITLYAGDANALFYYSSSRATPFSAQAKMSPSPSAARVDTYPIPSFSSSPAYSKRDNSFPSASRLRRM